MLGRSLGPCKKAFWSISPSSLTQMLTLALRHQTVKWADILQAGLLLEYSKNQSTPLL